MVYKYTLGDVYGSMYNSGRLSAEEITMKGYSVQIKPCYCVYFHKTLKLHIRKLE